MLIISVVSNSSRNSKRTCPVYSNLVVPSLLFFSSKWAFIHFTRNLFCGSYSTFINSLLSQDMSLANAKNSQEKCAKFCAALRSNTVPLRCSVCKKGFHQKCGTGPKDSNHGDHWNCDLCTKLQQIRIDASSVCQLPGSANSVPSQSQPAASWDKLKIYQRNADVIHSKFSELRDLLINSDINVLTVQESMITQSWQDSICWRLGHRTKWMR